MPTPAQRVMSACVRHLVPARRHSLAGIARAAPRSSGHVDRRRAIGAVVLAFVALWLVAFILSNSEVVRVSFVFAHVRLSLIWVMIICALLGGALAYGAPRLRRHRQGARRAVASASPARAGARPGSE